LEVLASHVTGARMKNTRGAPANCNNTRPKIFCHLHENVSNTAAGTDDDDCGTCSHVSLSQALGGGESDDASRARGLQVVTAGQLDDVGFCCNAKVSSATLAEACNVVPHSDLRDAGANSKNSAGEVSAGD
jgi:hypothetical protein